MSEIALGIRRRERRLRALHRPRRRPRPRRFAEKYYARIAKEPTRRDSKADDTVYVPQNHVHQWFNASETEPLVLLSCQNRLIKHLGYDNVVYLEDAPEYAGAAAVGPTS